MGKLVHTSTLPLFRPSSPSVPPPLRGICPSLHTNQSHALVPRLLSAWLSLLALSFAASICSCTQQATRSGVMSHDLTINTVVSHEAWFVNFHSCGKKLYIYLCASACASKVHSLIHGWMSQVTPVLLMITSRREAGDMKGRILFTSCLTSKLGCTIYPQHYLDEHPLYPPLPPHLDYLNLRGFLGANRYVRTCDLETRCIFTLLTYHHPVRRALSFLAHFLYIIVCSLLLNHLT